MLSKIIDWLLGTGRRKRPRREEMLKEIEIAEMELREELAAGPEKKPTRRRAAKKKAPTPRKKAGKAAGKKTAKRKASKKATKKKPKKKAVKKAATKKDEVFKYLKGRKSPAKISTIAKKAGVTEQTARRYLYYLRKSGKVKRESDGWVSK